MFFKSRGRIFDLIISPVSNISRVTARWQGHQTDFWNVPCELQSMWWTSKYIFSETEMSFFKVTGASVRGSRVSNLRPSLRGWRKCGCFHLQLAHKNVAAVKTKTRCRDQEEVTSWTLVSNFLLTYWNRFVFLALVQWTKKAPPSQFISALLSHSSRPSLQKTPVLFRPHVRSSVHMWSGSNAGLSVCSPPPTAAADPANGSSGCREHQHPFTVPFPGPQTRPTDAKEHLKMRENTNETSRSVEKRGDSPLKIVVSSWYMWLFLNRYKEIVYSVIHWQPRFWYQPQRGDCVILQMDRCRGVGDRKIEKWN